jgi:hypothetical protein
MGKLERVTAPHSSKVSVDKMLTEEQPREEITSFFVRQRPVNPSRYTEKREIAVEKFKTQATN